MRQQKFRRTTSVLTIVLLIGALFAPYRASSQPDPGRNVPSEHQVVKLGATIPLSGDAATYGKLIRDGLTLAQTQLKAEGYPLELIIEDVPSPGEKAISALRKMITIDHIDGLAANFFNGNIPAMAPIIASAKLPVFHTAIADDLILSAGEYVFTTNGTIQTEAQLVSDYAVNVMGARTAVTLYIGTTFGEGYAQHFATDFKRSGGKVLFEAMSPLGVDDHRATLLRVKAAKPDVIFAPHFGTTLGSLLKQLHEAKIDIPVVSVYEAEDPSVTSIAGAGADNLHFFEPEPIGSSPYREKFKRDFREMFGYEARVLAANAYDAAYLLTKATADCRRDTSCVKERLQRVRDFDGASGVFTIAANRAAERSFTLKTCKGGEFVAAAPNERTLRASYK